MSSARTVTSISPDTPVSCWSVFTSFSAWRSWGTSSRTSETTVLCVSSARPTTATASPMASTRLGCESEKPSVRQERSASHSPAAWTRGCERSAASRPLSVAGRRKRTSAAKPAHSAQPSASTMPSTSSAPKPRTMGTGDRRSTRKPVAVARPAVRIVGPPATAAATAGSSSSRPLAARETASLYLAWNWIA